MAVVASTTSSTGREIELVLNAWPATPVSKMQIILALDQLRDFLLQTSLVP